MSAGNRTGPAIYPRGAAAARRAIAAGSVPRIRGGIARALLDTHAERPSAARPVSRPSVDCDDDRHKRRYTEPRTHLLAGDRPVLDAIRHERQMHPALRQRADLSIERLCLTARHPKRRPGCLATLRGGKLRVFVTPFVRRREYGRRVDPISRLSGRRNSHHLDGLSRSRAVADSASAQPLRPIAAIGCCGEAGRPAAPALGGSHSAEPATAGVQLTPPHLRRRGERGRMRRRCCSSRFCAGRGRPLLGRAGLPGRRPSK
jgi:hypothetical protein